MNRFPGKHRVYRSPPHTPPHSPDTSPKECFALRSSYFPQSNIAKNQSYWRFAGHKYTRHAPQNPNRSSGSPAYPPTEYLSLPPGCICTTSRDCVWYGNKYSRRYTPTWCKTKLYKVTRVVSKHCPQYYRHILPSSPPAPNIQKCRPSQAISHNLQAPAYSLSAPRYLWEYGTAKNLLG